MFLFGARTIFLGLALIFLMNQKYFFRRRFDRCGRLDRSRCSKTLENSLAFTLYLPTLCNEIDAARFSGPEQFSSGLRWFSFRFKIWFAALLLSSISHVRPFTQPLLSSALALPLYLFSLFSSFFLSFLLSLFPFSSHHFAKDKFKCGLVTREKLVC